MAYRANTIRASATPCRRRVWADEGVARLHADRLHRHVQLLGNRLNHLRVDALD